MAWNPLKIRVERQARRAANKRPSHSNQIKHHVVSLALPASVDGLLILKGDGDHNLLLAPSAGRQRAWPAQGPLSHDLSAWREYSFGSDWSGLCVCTFTWGICAGKEAFVLEKLAARKVMVGSWARKNVSTPFKLCLGYNKGDNLFSQFFFHKKLVTNISNFVISHLPHLSNSSIVGAAARNSSSTLSSLLPLSPQLWDLQSPGRFQCASVLIGMLSRDPLPVVSPSLPPLADSLDMLPFSSVFLALSNALFSPARRIRPSMPLDYLERRTVVRTSTLTKPSKDSPTLRSGVGLVQLT